jgi:hypothetical protein
VTEDRQPSDPALERDVIAACLLRPETVSTIGLGEDDFAFEPHRKVWHAMQTLSEMGEQVDLMRVRSRLIDSDSLAAVGGALSVPGDAAADHPRQEPARRQTHSADQTASTARCRRASGERRCRQ